MSLGLRCLPLKNETAELGKSEVPPGSKNFQLQNAIKGFQKTLNFFYIFSLRMCYVNHRVVGKRVTLPPSYPGGSYQALTLGDTGWKHTVVNVEMRKPRAPGRERWPGMDY